MKCEIDYLRRHDLALQRTMEAVEMPDRVAENLVMFIRQNNGTLSKNRREREFKLLTDDDEVQQIDHIIRATHLKCSIIIRSSPSLTTLP